MSIDRNSYLSLIESVNEAVSPKAVGKMSKGGKLAARSRTKVSKSSAQMGSPAMKSAGGGGQGGGNKPIEWGDPRIGGAMNGYELAQWLNKQTVAGPGISEALVMKSTKPAKTANVTKSKPKVIASVKSKSPAATTSTAAGMASKTSNVAAGSGLQWGSKSIGGANNAQDLARWLNSQSTAGPMPMKEGLMPKKPKKVPLPPPDPNRNNPMKGPLAEEDFDIIDEILAEGLELYGEEDLAEILADFEETGEISEELADLLGLDVE